MARGTAGGDYGATVVMWIIVGALAASAALLGGFVAFSERRHRRIRRRVGRLDQGPAPDIAYRAVVNARSAFTRSVQAYEEAIASAPTTAALTGIGDAALGAEIQVMERKKDLRRTRLIEAQQTWEKVRPALGPDSPVNVWIGAGEVYGWSLGLVGFESAILRIEHALDPTCWVVLESRRLRLGPALGGERLRLGVLVEGARIEQLTAVLQAAMGSPEVALRPGFSLMRLLGESRTKGRSVLKALRRDAKSTETLYQSGIGDLPRRDALSYLAAERGLDLGDTHAGLAKPIKSINLRIGSAGPAFLVGMWAGRRPSARVLAGSNHQPWVRHNR